MFSDLMKRARSYRRFDAKRRLPEALVESLIEDARLSASAGNLQRIRYAVITGENTCQEIRKNIAFAAYLKDWDGPDENENPTAYIVLMTTKVDNTALIDIGIAAQTIILSATDKGLGGCMFGSFNKEELTRIAASDGYEPRLVIALGYPAETSLVTEGEPDDIKYYRKDDVHYVPKLSLQTLIVTRK